MSRSYLLSPMRSGDRSTGCTAVAHAPANKGVAAGERASCRPLKWFRFARGLSRRAAFAVTQIFGHVRNRVLDHFVRLRRFGWLGVLAPRATNTFRLLAASDTGRCMVVKLRVTGESSPSERLFVREFDEPMYRGGPVARWMQLLKPSPTAKLLFWRSSRRRKRSPGSRTSESPMKTVAPKATKRRRRLTQR
jgi:hypothetical protein